MSEDGVLGGGGVARDGGVTGDGGLLLAAADIGKGLGRVAIKSSNKFLARNDPRKRAAEGRSPRLNGVRRRSTGGGPPSLLMYCGRRGRSKSS